MAFVVLGWPDDKPRLRLDYRRFAYAGKFVTGRLGVAVVRSAAVDTNCGAVDTNRDTVDTNGDTVDTNRGASGASDVDIDPNHTRSSASLPALPDGLSESDFADDILAAVAFSADRTDEETLWLRYLTVRRDLRGSGRELGPRLAAFITARAADRGYQRARIAVNNVFSYRALYKAGFAYTGRQTGIAELVLERPTARPAAVSRSRYRRGLSVFAEREGLSPAERTFLDARREGDPPPLCSAVTEPPPESGSAPESELTPESEPAPGVDRADPDCSE